MKRYGVNFDIGYYIEVEAKDENEALEKAKDRISEAEEGEAHNFDVEKISDKEFE